jgi:type IV pilus assembly protein PilE
MMLAREKLSRGFTLIELMIVVAIVAILATIAYPSYLEQVTNSRRAEGMDALLIAASQQEQFFTANSRYQTAGEFNAISETGLYGLTMTPIGAGYRLTATPTIAVWTDPVCGNFTLSNIGRRLVTGDANLDGAFPALNPTTAAQLVVANADAVVCWP